jgi:hypothetical protein
MSSNNGKSYDIELITIGLSFWVRLANGDTLSIDTTHVGMKDPFDVKAYGQTLQLAPERLDVFLSALRQCGGDYTRLVALYPGDFRVCVGAVDPATGLCQEDFKVYVSADDPATGERTLLAAPSGPG